MEKGHRDYRVRNSVGKGGRCGRVKNIPAGAPCCVLTSPQVILRHGEVQEPLSRGKLRIFLPPSSCEFEVRECYAWILTFGENALVAVGRMD